MKFSLYLTLIIVLSPLSHGAGVGSLKPINRCSKEIANKWNKKEKIQVATVDTRCDGIGTVKRNGVTYNKSEIFDGRKYFTKNNGNKNFDCNEAVLKQSFIDCRVNFKNVYDDYKIAIEDSKGRANSWLTSGDRYRWETLSYNSDSQDIRNHSDFKAYCIDEMAVCGMEYALVGLKAQHDHCNYLLKRGEYTKELYRCGEKLAADASYINKYIPKLLELEKAKESGGAKSARYFDGLAEHFGATRDDIDALLNQIDTMKVAAQYTQNEDNSRDVLKKCQQIVDKDGNDVKGRALASKVIDQMSSVQCIATDDVGIGLDKLVTDMKSFELNLQISDLNKDINKEALYKMARATWATYRRFRSDSKDPKQNKEFYLNIVRKKIPEGSRDDDYSKVLEKAFADFVKPGEDGVSEADKTRKYAKSFFEKGRNDLNKTVQKVNSLCQEAKKVFRDEKAYSECESSASCSKDTFSFEYPGARGLGLREMQQKNRIDNRINSRNMMTPGSGGMIDKKGGYEKIEAKFAPLKVIHEEYYKKIMSEYMNVLHTDLNFLLVTEKFGNKLGVLGRGKNMGEGVLGTSAMANGDWLTQHCYAGDGKLMQEVSLEDIKSGVDEFVSLVDADYELIEDSATRGQSKKKDIIKDYLKSHPKTLADMLAKSDSEDYRLALCSMIRDINSSDKLKRNAQMVVGGIGAVASIALMATGVGSGAGAALLGVSVISLGAEVTMINSDISNNEKEIKSLGNEYAINTNEVEIDNILKQMGLKEQENKESKIWRGFAIAGLAFDGVEGLRLAKLLSTSSKLKKLRGLHRIYSPGIESDTQFLKESQKGLKKLRDLYKARKIRSGDAFKPQPIGNKIGYTEEAFLIGYYASRMKEVDLVEFVNKLSKLRRGSVQDYEKVVSIMQLNPQKFFDKFGRLKFDKFDEAIAQAKESTRRNIANFQAQFTPQEINSMRGRITASEILVKNLKVGKVDVTNTSQFKKLTEVITKDIENGLDPVVIKNHRNIDNLSSSLESRLDDIGSLMDTKWISDFDFTFVVAKPEEFSSLIGDLAKHARWHKILQTRSLSEATSHLKAIENTEDGLKELKEIESLFKKKLLEGQSYDSILREVIGIQGVIDTHIRGAMKGSSTP